MHDPNYAYRADIDGLRAVAVSSVLIYHAFPDALPGGFIGVDIFFVISGFLITNILQSEIKNGCYSVSRFYARRIKRLSPALMLVLVFTLTIGWFVLLRDEFRHLGKQAVAGAAFVSNIALWMESGYFDQESNLKPLLHLWSLGVEEQFYIFWPLIIALVVRIRTNLVIIVAGLGFASFVADISLVERDPTSAFFLPFMRFWELMIGALLSSEIFATHYRPGVGRTLVLGALREAASLIGLTLIVTSLVLVKETRPFPGWWTLLPTVGTALVIVTGPYTWLARHILSLRAMVCIGLISYPLYLWHWPLFSFSRIVNGAPPPTEVRLLIIVVSLGLAWLTYRYVELPLRYSRGQGGSKKVIASFGAPLVAACFAGLLVFRGFPEERLAALSSELSAARSDWHYPGDKLAQIPGNLPRTVLFLGDSYVQQLFPRVKELSELQDHYHTVMFKTVSGCAPVPGIARKSDPKCATSTDRGFEIAGQEDILAVVVGASWLGMIGRGDYYRRDDPAETILDLKDTSVLDNVLVRFEKALRDLVLLDKRVYIVLNPPGGGLADPGVIPGIRLHFVSRLFPVKSISMRQHLERTGNINNRIRALAKRVGAVIIDPAGWICRNGECFVTDEKGVPRFKDATHFRASFVRCCIRDFDGIVVPDAQSISTSLQN